MLPNVSDALPGWEQEVSIKTVTTTTVDFKPTDVVTVKPFLAVCQPTKKTRLNADILDWSRVHTTFHSAEAMTHGQFIEYKGKDFKIIDPADYSEYGYWVAIGEETLKPLLQATP